MRSLVPSSAAAAVVWLVILSCIVCSSDATFSYKPNTFRVLQPLPLNTVRFPTALESEIESWKLNGNDVISHTRYTNLMPFSIEDFGAKSGITTPAQALANGKAFYEAILAANTTTDIQRRAVLIPVEKSFSFLPFVSLISNVNNLTILIEGKIDVFSYDFVTYWPGFPNDTYVIMNFAYCNDFSVISTTGKGVINGHGTTWWWYTILVREARSNMLQVSQSRNFHLQGVTFHNSPRYHVLLSDMVAVIVEDCTVLVDQEEALQLMRFVGQRQQLESDLVGMDWFDVMEKMRGRHFGLSFEDTLMSVGLMQSPEIDPAVPMVWALNTDGIDVSGRDMVVKNCRVTNFDDSVCMKPLASDGRSVFGTNCSTNTQILNITVIYGVGISMGSVPPDIGTNCISDIFIKNITFQSPLKAVYIKPNPAKKGKATGLISNIRYEDISIHDALWFPIFIGTQQQSQPHSTGTGCSFLYPAFNTSCPTDPEVTLRNISIVNLQSFNGKLSPGIIIANVTNPGTDFYFENVVFHNVTHWPMADGGFLCQHVYGTSINSFPVPCFLDPTSNMREQSRRGHKSKGV